MTTEAKKDVVLMRGIGVSSGIVIGRAHVLDSGRVNTAVRHFLDEAAADREVGRFTEAIKRSRGQLNAIKRKLKQEGMGKEHLRIMDAHLMMLKDQMLIDDTIKIIEGERVNAEWALKKVLSGIKEFFDRMDDEYLRERSADIEHLVNRVLQNLAGNKESTLSDIKEPSVVVTHDLSPTDTAQMDKKLVLAFLTDIGGRTSHTAIMGRALEIPAVVGLEKISVSVEQGDRIVVDGMTGAVIINPSESVVKVYEKRRERYEKYEKTLSHFKDLPSETTDGHRVSLMGNMELVEEIGSLTDHGSEGIGLYRSEFLYLNRKNFPTEEEHMAAYRQVVKTMAPNPVVIRTLDLGGEKLHPDLDDIEEANPALGLRAIRFCLKRTDLFRTQLRALLRASAFGDLKILLPMISGVDELRRAKSFIEEVKVELRGEGCDFDENIKLGAMIEVPSAALIADLIAKEVDFFSIGTNDLLQYSLAIDRVNEHVAYLYEPFHPAVIRTVKGVIDAAHAASITVSVCGEMAGEPEHALIFLGMGIDELSMNAFSLLRVKRLIRSVSYAEAREISERVLDFSTASEVESFVVSRLSEYYKEEFWR